MKYIIFGESHGSAIGVAMEGVPAGISLDLGLIQRELDRRAPGKNRLSTARQEADEFKLISGVFEGKTTGAPLCAMIENTDTRSRDYEQMRFLARPGHADYTGYVKYNGCNDYRGGGHFSGRLTAPLVFAGALAKQILEPRGIVVGAHIREIHGIRDAQPDRNGVTGQLLCTVAAKLFPVIDDLKGEEMIREIDRAREKADSVGGIIECAVLGLPAGAGEPGQESAEGIISRQMFAVPAVKGIEFGAGFAFANMLGSEGNDPFSAGETGVHTETNHNGGINGGITNGMPVVFSVVIKPTPSIGQKQRTIDMRTGHKEEILIEGRHDPCIVHRAVPVIEAAAALAVCEILKI